MTLRSLHLVAFREGITRASCTLVIPADGRIYPSPGEPKIGVEHPGCAELADLSVDLDAFYCPRCGYNGRVSGAWAVDVIERKLAADA